MIRVFARRTKWTPMDDLAFYDGPPLFNMPEMPVRVNCVFSWDKDRAIRLGKEWAKRFRDVKVGGPAFGDPGGEFVPERFVKRGVIFTSHGCPKRCPWCYAWKREGNIRELKIQEGWIVQDNNLLACSRSHIERVFEMLKKQPLSASFPGGLDLDYLSDWHIELFKGLRKNHRLGILFVAFDTEKSLEKLSMARDLLGDFHINQRFAYALIGFDGDTIEQAESRLERIYDDERGFLPFAMLFDKNSKSHEWKKLQRKWARPAAYRGRKNFKSEL